MKAVAATGAPISPSSTSRRAVWIAVPNTVSGAQPIRRPAASAASSIAVASSRSTAKRLLLVHVLARSGAPRSRPRACACGGVRLTTSSTAGSASSSANGRAGTSRSAATRAAADATSSHTATSRTFGSLLNESRYCPEMFPQPTTATVTGSAATPALTGSPTAAPARRSD